MSARGPRIAAAVLLAGLFGAVSGAAVAAPETSAVPASFDAAAMLPGEARTSSEPVSLPLTARVIDTSWSTTGAADWTVDLCDSRTCLPFESLADTVLAAGDYDLRATVRMPGDVAQGVVATARGEIRFAEFRRQLAGTGGVAPFAALGAGLAATLTGLFFIVAARRRREERS